MINRLTVALVVMFFVLPTAAELELGEDGLPKQDMLRAFEPYTGRLVVNSENRPTDLIPEPLEMTGEQEGKYILDGTMFRFRSIAEIDGVKSENIFLYGFDRVEGSYCCWYYQQGALAFKYKVEWAEDGKSYNQSLFNEEEVGYSITTHVKLGEGKPLLWATQVMTSEGKSVVDQTGVLTPAPGEVAFPEPKAKEDDKLKMYRPFAGRWDSITKGKATDVVEEPYETTGPWVQSNTLGGDMIEMRGAVEVEDNPYQYLWLYMYDTREKAYVAWFHDSRGVHTKMYGNWSATDKQMTWTLDNPQKHGVMVTIVDDISDPDRVGFTFKMEGDDGKLIMDEVGYATRPEEE